MKPAAAAKAWQCSVCGYIHRGTEPPECCPVCGSAQADFLAYAGSVPTILPPPRRWRCLNCKHIHDGTEPPGACPVCAAPKDRFEPAAEAGPTAMAAAPPAKVVVIGAGIAGVTAVESLRQAAPQAAITLIAKEAELPYYRLNLTRLLAGEIGEDALPMHPREWYAAQRVEVVSGTEVSGVRLAEHALELRDGRLLPFEKLVLAMGAHPFMPPLPGTNIEGVTSLRTRDDARRILEACRPGTRCVCIGGGILGIETAGGLARRGMDVTLLEGHGWLMPRQLNQAAGDLLAEYLHEAGIRLRTRARTAEIVGDERVAGVLLDDGATLPADLVVVATGVRPNSYLARRAGLEVNKGVVVDNHLRTSHPDVFAAGDVAEHRGELYGNWGAAQYQGSIAGMNAGGGQVEFGGIPRANTLKVLGAGMMSIGTFEPEDGSYQVIEERAGRTYTRFVFRDSLLVGAILLGDTAMAAQVKKAEETRTDFSGVLARKPAVRDVLAVLAAGG